MGRNRYSVSVFGRLHATDAIGSVDVSHDFTARSAAEGFARAISMYLPAPNTDGPLAWVLVYAHASIPHAVHGPTFCYLSYDPGAVMVKHHAIPCGYFGHAGGATRKRAPRHPASVALHAAHKSFRASMGATGVGPCFDSDLVHDDKAIAAHPEQPFVWLISRHGTHTARLGTPVECYTDVCRAWSQSQMSMFLRSVCVECYDRTAIPEGWLKLYLWDGATLTHYPTLAEFQVAVTRAMRDRALQYIAGRRAAASDDLSVATCYGNTTSATAVRLGGTLASLDDETTTIQESGWGHPHA